MSMFQDYRLDEMQKVLYKRGLFFAVNNHGELNEIKTSKRTGLKSNGSSDEP